MEDRTTQRAAVLRRFTELHSATCDEMEMLNAKLEDAQQRLRDIQMVLEALRPSPEEKAVPHSQTAESGREKLDVLQKKKEKQRLANTVREMTMSDAALALAEYHNKREASTTEVREWFDAVSYHTTHGNRPTQNVIYAMLNRQYTIDPKGPIQRIGRGRFRFDW
jgi:hypothetical protein